MTQRATQRRLLLLGSAIVVAVLGLDQLTKWVILDAIGPGSNRGPITIIPAVLEFRFVRNTGSAFGLFQGSSDILKFAAVAAVLVLLIYYLRAAARDWLMTVALALQLGGAFGNIVDRYRHGYVVDFIGFPRFPTFNVADSAITLGVILLIYVLLFRDTGEGQRRSTGTDSPVAAGDDA